MSSRAEVVSHVFGRYYRRSGVESAAKKGSRLPARASLGWDAPGGFGKFSVRRSGKASIAEGIAQVRDLVGEAGAPRRPRVARATTSASSVLESRFRALVAEWQVDAEFSSRIYEQICHPAFLKIVALGSVALPLVLEEARTGSLAWFWALEAIHGANPAAEAETVDESLAIWERILKQ